MAPRPPLPDKIRYTVSAMMPAPARTASARHRPGSGGRGALAAAYLALKAVTLVAALFARQLVRRSAWEPVGKSGEIPAE